LPLHAQKANFVLYVLLYEITMYKVNEDAKIWIHGKEISIDECIMIIKGLAGLKKLTPSPTINLIYENMLAYLPPEYSYIELD
jgi:hypothetical protein